MQNLTPDLQLLEEISAKGGEIIANGVMTLSPFVAAPPDILQQMPQFSSVIMQVMVSEKLAQVFGQFSLGMTPLEIGIVIGREMERRKQAALMAETFIHD